MVSTSEVGKMDSFPDGLVVKKNARVVSLSVGAEVFSPEAVPSGGAPTGEGQKNTGTMHPLGRYPGGGVFGLNDAAVLTPAVVGAASPAVFSGAVAPADLARTDVPAVAGKEFSAVAEDLSLADDAEGSSVIRVSKQLRAVVGVGPMRDVGSVEGRRPVGLLDSDDDRPSEEGSSLVDIVTVP